jgi:hypothetical protein
MKRACFAVCALLLFSSLPLFAADRIGEATYLEGTVSVLRNGASLDEGEVQVGMDILNFDIMKTGSTSLAELKIATTKAPPMTIKMSANTQFSFEISKLESKNQNAIGLISGSLSMKVSKLTGSQAVTVRTDAAAMGVRGTQFTVTAPPSGDILVTCDEGEVTCTDENGNRLSALPGTAIEKPQGEAFRKIPVAVSNLESFRANWLAERIEALRANALRAIQNYAKRYDTLYADFNANYATLLKSQAIITKWLNEDKRGKIGGAMEVMREKKEIIGSLFKLRANLFIFERIYYRLVELEDYYRQGYGRGLISTGVTTDQFFQKFDAQSKDLERKMAVVHNVARLYALRNEGSVPGGSFDESDSGSTDDFFGN